MDTRNRCSAFLAARDRHNLGLGMPQKDFDRLEGCVAGGAEDCDLDHDMLRVRDEDLGFIGWPQVRRLPRREVG